MGMRVFVIRELHPFTAGGIGRVIYNILKTQPVDRLRDFGVVYVGDAVTAGAFETLFPGAAFMQVEVRDYATFDENGRRYPPLDAFSDSALHGESVLVVQALQRFAETHGELAYVEFVDWGAAAFAATQEKRFGRAFNETVLAVRLHTTDSILADYEVRTPNLPALSLYDLERKALADCDLVVAQLPSVGEAIRQFYGFNEEEWNPRVVVHAPPVLIDGVEKAGEPIRPAARTPILFTSKLQQIKRPDVFVAGCVEFMRQHPAYTGNAIFLAHSFDAAYRSRIEEQIPSDLRPRFVFAQGITGNSRNELIAQSICVFPSPWESFCLAAYEAAQSGAICVLNAGNPAFGRDTPWLDAVNCVKFADGSKGLATALQALFDGGQSVSSVVSIGEQTPPWELERRERQSGNVVPMLRVSALVYPGDENGALAATLDSVVASSFPVSQILLVDNASTDPVTRHYLEVLARSVSRDDMEVVQLPSPLVLGAVLNHALKQVRGELCLFIRAGDVISPDLIARAAGGLALDQRFDFVVASSGRDPDAPLGVQPRPHQFHRIVTGEARAAGWHENRFATDTFMARTSTARGLQFNSQMRTFVVWDFMSRAVARGSRVLVSSSVDIECLQPAIRRMSDETLEAEKNASLQLKMGRRVTLDNMQLPGYVFASSSSGDGAVPGFESDTHMRELAQSETVRIALTLAHAVQRHAPWALRLGKRAMRVLKL